MNLYEKYGISDFDVWLLNEGTLEKSYDLLGCHYIEKFSAHRFTVFAPHASSVSLVGDFNDWDSFENPMEKLDCGIFACLAENLSDGISYKYAVTDTFGKTVLKADPFAFYAGTDADNSSRIFDIENYPWTDADYLENRKSYDTHKNPMSIYEVHLASWKKYGDSLYPNYRILADELAEYCLYMGYSHIELMPITEYPYGGSWGYQVTGYFAPTSRYGTPHDFMYFVDKMHSVGIKVILDWVPAHFPKDRHGLGNFDGTSLFECDDYNMANHPHWGTLIFDYAKPFVRSFLISSAMMFFDKYHIDGIRVDAVSSMLYLDYGRDDGNFIRNCDGGNINYAAENFIRQLNDSVNRNFSGVVTIAEESTSYANITTSTARNGLGFSYKWDMGYMHDKLEYMKLDPLFRSGAHNLFKLSMDYAHGENYVLPFSHDEVVHGKGSLLNKMWGNIDEKFRNLRALWGITYAHTGKKLMFMGIDFAQVEEWNYEQSLDWHLLDRPLHKSMHNYIRDLNLLYKSMPALYERDRGQDGFMWLSPFDDEISCAAFLRTSIDGSMIVCVTNLTPIDREHYNFGLPFSGTLTRLISSDEAQYGGADYLPCILSHSRKRDFLHYKHTASVSIAGLSTTIYEFTKEAH